MTRFKTSDGLSLTWSDEGKGLPVLCLAGLTRDMSDFDDFAGVVGDEVRLLRLTSRGRNGSDRDLDPMNYIVPVEAGDALEFLDFLGIERAVIVGTSRGGLIAMAIAASAPERLAGVLLNDIGPEIATAGIERIKGYLGKNAPFESHEDAADGLLAENTAGFPGVSRERWLKCAQRWWRASPDGLQITYDPALLDALVAGSAQPMPDMWPLFDALKGIPLALLRGANSDILSEESAREMCARRPDLVFAEVPDRAHVPFLDEPQSVVAFRELVRRVSA